MLTEPPRPVKRWFSNSPVHINHLVFKLVQVPRLMENFQPEEVHDAVRDAIRLGAVSFDAVKHLVLCRIEGRPPRLDMELYPYLPRTNVATTSTRDYMALLAGSRS